MHEKCIYKSDSDVSNINEYSASREQLNRHFDFRHTPLGAAIYLHILYLCSLQFGRIEKKKRNNRNGARNNVETKTRIIIDFECLISICRCDDLRLQSVQFAYAFTLYWAALHLYAHTSPNVPEIDTCISQDHERLSVVQSARQWNKIK